jgi:hypothetical protein
LCEEDCWGKLLKGHASFSKEGVYSLLQAKKHASTRPFRKSMYVARVGTEEWIYIQLPPWISTKQKRKDGKCLVAAERRGDSI